MSTRFALVALGALVLLGCGDDAQPNIAGTVVCTDCAPGALRRTVTPAEPFTQIAPTGEGGLAVLLHDTFAGGEAYVLDAALAHEVALGVIGFRLAAAGSDVYVLDLEDGDVSQGVVRVFTTDGDERWAQPVGRTFDALTAAGDGVALSAPGGDAIDHLALDTGAPSRIPFVAPQVAGDPAGGLFVTTAEMLSTAMTEVVRLEAGQPVWTRSIGGPETSQVELRTPTPLPDHRVAVLGRFTGAALRAGTLVLEPPDRARPQLMFLVELAADGTPERLIALPYELPANATLVAAAGELLLVWPDDNDIVVSRLDGDALVELQRIGGVDRQLALATAGTSTGLWLVVDSRTDVDVGGTLVTPANGQTVAIELAL